MKFKAMIASLVFLAMCGSMVGCGSESSSNSTTSENNSSAALETKDSAQSSEGTDSESSEKDDNAQSDFSMPTELTDNLYDYRVMIGDEVLTFPDSLHDFTVLGWENNEEYTRIGGNGGTYSIDLKKSNMQITVRATNNTEELIDRLEEGADKGLDVKSFTCSALWNEAAITLPNGIILGESTADDIVAAYGEPMEKSTVNSDMMIYAYYEGEPLDDYKTANEYVTITVKKNDAKEYIAQIVTFERKIQ